MLFRTLSKLLLLCIFLTICAFPGKAQTDQLNTSQDTLVVGLAGSEPFVFKEMGKGIATEIWDEIADK